MTSTIRNPLIGITSVLLGALVLGCGGGGLDGLEQGGDPTDGPGSDPWAHGRNIDDASCAGDADCLTGETCLDGVCQMQRCTAYASSSAPLGSDYAFFWDREFVVADDNLADGAHWADGYAPSPTALTYERSWSIGGSAIRDVVGGNFIEGTPDEIAIAEEGSNSVNVVADAAITPFDVGFVPVALAAGDLDHSGLDEIVAVGEQGDLAVCSMATESCERFSIAGVTVLDATAGDVDGDGYAEPVFLMLSGATRVFYVLNTDYELTGQEQVLTSAAPLNLIRIAAGDVDGDGTAEILGLEDGALVAGVTDTLTLFRLEGAMMAAYVHVTVAFDTTDIVAGNLGGQAGTDMRDKVALVRQAGYVDVYQQGTSSPLAFEFSAPLGTTGKPKRVAMVDFDGDTPRGRLVEGPIPTPGRVAPTMLLQLPPYDREHSDGGSNVGVGDGSSTSQGWDQGVSFNIGTSLGMGADLFGFFSGGVSESMGISIGRSQGVSSSVSVGNSFGIGADPARFGASQASVVLACGCFLNYIYEVEDPQGVLGGTGGRLSILVPVGGQSAVWDVRRYNAMARAVGGMPIIETNEFVSGDLASYPQAPELPDGSPVPASDMVVGEPPSYFASDVGSTSWSISVSQGTSSGISLGTSIGTGTSYGVLGFSYGSGSGEGWSSSYGMSFGTNASFGGGIPAVPNAAGTPEDEYLLYRYSFRPYVYVQHYVDDVGVDAAYYVITYTVER